MDFSNLVILVTGASSDLGNTLIDILKYNNATVIGTYHHRKPKSNIPLIKCDITKEKDVKEVYEYLKDHYNGVDVLINLAALSLDEHFKEKDANSFMEVLKTNVLGTFLLCKYFALYNDKGTIINMSSLDASLSYNEYNMDYACSKSAAENLTKNFAYNLKNIKVCALAPGWINTDNVLNIDEVYLKRELERTKQERLLKKEEVALKIIEMIVNNDDYVTGDIVKMKEGEDYGNN